MTENYNEYILEADPMKMHNGRWAVSVSIDGIFFG